MTPGSQTTEYKVLKWVGAIAAIVIAIGGFLTTMGFLPTEGFMATAVAALLSAAHYAASYAKSRSVVKAAEAIGTADRALP